MPPHDLLEEEEAPRRRLPEPGFPHTAATLGILQTAFSGSNYLQEPQPLLGKGERQVSPRGTGWMGGGKQLLVAPSVNIAPLGNGGRFRTGSERGISTSPTAIGFVTPRGWPTGNARRVRRSCRGCRSAPHPAPRPRSRLIAATAERGRLPAGKCFLPRGTGCLAVQFPIGQLRQSRQEPEDLGHHVIRQRGSQPAPQLVPDRGRTWRLARTLAGHNVGGQVFVAGPVLAVDDRRLRNLCMPPAPPRFRPTRCGMPESSPGCRAGPGTRCCRRADSGSDRPSCSSRRPATPLNGSGINRSAVSSGRFSNRDPRPRRRCTTRRGRRSRPGFAARPECTGGCWVPADRSARLGKRVSARSPNA